MSRLLVRASMGGALLGLVVAQLLRVALINTPVQIPPNRFAWQALLLALAGGLAGFALSAVKKLLAANPDPEYHQHHR